jgi:hypothetical protein
MPPGASLWDGLEGCETGLARFELSLRMAAKQWIFQNIRFYAQLMI